MFPLGRFLFICIVATFIIALYGDKLVNIVNNEVRLSESPSSANLVSSSNLVHDIEIPVQRDGHYWLSMRVSGQDIKFVVDTGASFVTLSYQDAQKMNLFLHDNDFDVPVNTAGGKTMMAEINIDVMTFNYIEFYNVKALVAKEGMLNVSLLGMNYLRRLDGFEFRDKELILRH